VLTRPPSAFAQRQRAYRQRSARRGEHGTMHVEDAPATRSPILTDHARERAQVRDVSIRIVVTSCAGCCG
jgi:hypothetical protein